MTAGTSGTTWQLGRRPALDGLRGTAVLMVMFGHAYPAHSQLAMAGVGVFFTLSGFLITALLLQERDDCGSVRLGAFYRRRALRLLPAVAVFLACLVVFEHLRWEATLPVFLYVQNWTTIASAGGGGAVLHCWSLSVEEQFYLAWPAVLLCAATLGRRALLWLTVAGAATSLLVGRVLIDHDASIYRVAYGSDTNAVALLAGCTLAIFLVGGPVRTSRPMAGLAAVAAIFGFGAVHTMWQLPAVPILTAAGIYCLVAGEHVRCPRWLVLVGQRSYALYLWSTPLAFGLLLGPLRDHASDWVAVPIFVAVSWAVATLSWHAVERPFLRLKDRQVMRSKVAHAGTPVARVVVPEPAALNIWAKHSR